MTLKVPVAIGDRACGVNLGTVVAGLPDFNQSSTDRSAAPVKHAVRYSTDVAESGRDCIVDDEQIVVEIEEKLVRVVRSDRHVGR